MHFRFALISQECFCGNVGSQERKQLFSVLSSRKYNLSTIMQVAKKLQLDIVCSESVKRMCETSFSMRYVDTQNLKCNSTVEKQFIQRIIILEDEEILNTSSTNLLLTVVGFSQTLFQFIHFHVQHVGV